MSCLTNAAGEPVEVISTTTGQVAAAAPPTGPWADRSLLMLSAIWALLIAIGMLFMWSYAHTPGPQRVPPSQWPDDTALIRAGDQPTLVLFAHPHCPCTRASIAELARIVAKCHGQLDTMVVFIKPTQFELGWEQSELWRMAEQIPGVSIHRDDGGVETSRFAAEISGLTLVYDAEGRLLFRGGITSARGHQGDNKGRRAVIALVTTGTARHHQSPVFGCPLHDTDTPNCAAQNKVVCRSSHVSTP